MSHELSREYCRPRTGVRFDVEGVEYELGGDLGDGAVGIVRKAIRKKDNKNFAVKFLAPDPKYIEISNFDDVSARFQREGEKGAKLDHDHLIKIYAFCENKNGCQFEETNYPTNPFILMERVYGKPLESYIRRISSRNKREFTVNQKRLHVAIQIVNAVAELHSIRLIHRDIKPANIFIFNNPNSHKYPLVKLGDFGIVKWGDFHSALSTGVFTATNQKGLGTLKYMSPEQAVNPKSVTNRCDIYSLGITLFELFSGQILASPHHVFEIMSARLLRGTTTSRFLSMNYNIKQSDEHIGQLLLDMHLRGPSGRPNIEKVKGILEHEYETRFDSNWQSDTDLEVLERKSDAWEED